MAKRRRCKDTLPRSDHEWGQGVSGRPTHIAFAFAGGTSGAQVVQYWCPGIEKEAKDE